MYKYFEMLKQVADTDSTEYQISDLTKEIAIRAGYHRKFITLKNGVRKMHTEYTEPFDNVLTAKWLMYFKNLFILKLGKHPELSEYHVQIINDTFLMFMKRLQLSKAFYDKGIMTYVYDTLYHRITQVLFERGSCARLEAFKNGEKRKFRYCSVLNTVSTSYDALLEQDNNFDVVDYDDELDIECVLFDLKEKLKYNPYGIRLLNAMLGAGRRVKLSAIDNYVELSDDEKTEETKKYLLDAWNTIVTTLKGYIDTKDNYTWRKARSIKYASEVE